MVWHNLNGDLLRAHSLASKCGVTTAGSLVTPCNRRFTSTQIPGLEPSASWRATRIIATSLLLQIQSFLNCGSESPFEAFHLTWSALVFDISNMTQVEWHVFLILGD